jgi:hypothetical protein
MLRPPRNRSKGRHKNQKRGDHERQIGSFTGSHGSPLSLHLVICLYFPAAALIWVMAAIETLQEMAADLSDLYQCAEVESGR